MAAFLSFFLGTSLRALVFRTMALLGIGVIGFTGSQFVLDGVIDLFVDYANELPSQYLSLMGFIWIDRAFGLIVSAATVAITIRSARS